MSVWGGDPLCEHEWGEAMTGRVTTGGGPPRPPQTKWRTAPSPDSGRPRRFCVRCGAWLGELGLEPNPFLYVAHLVEVFREVRRVLRPDGVAWLNLGDTYVGSWGNYGARGGKQRERSAERYERRAYEHPEMGNRSRPPTCGADVGVPFKNLALVPERAAIALQEDGWIVRSDVIWEKPNTMPESVGDRPSENHEYCYMLAKSERYFWDWYAVMEPADNEDGTPGLRRRRTVWRVKTVPYRGAHFAVFPPNLVEPMILSSTSPRACGACGAPWKRKLERQEAPDAGEYEGKWEGLGNASGSRALKSAKKWREAGMPHNQPFPVPRHAGWEPTCGCPGNAGEARCVVLDPFFGSGTTGKVAEGLGRAWIGFDMQEGYASLQAARTGQASMTQALFRDTDRG